MSKTICYGAGCDRSATRKGLCGKHYDRLRRRGDVNYERPAPLSQGLCSVPGCAKNYLSRGLCNMHYLRLTLRGDVGEAEPEKWVTEQDNDDIVARIMERTEIVGTCIQWTGYAIQSGYGTIHWRGKEWVVHRAMWTAKVGPIPTDDDWTIDHLCLNRRCVNVQHLEVVTRVENTRRGGGLAIAHKLNKARSLQSPTCRNGHPKTDENSYWGNAGRICKPCKKAAWQRRKAKQEAPGARLH